MRSHAASVLPGLLAFALVACTSEDPAAPIDAAPSIDATPRSCTVDAELGALGMRTGTPMASGAPGSRIVSVSMTVASDASTRDVVFVQLKGGRGAFATSDPVPGVFPITGADADYATCGVCVTVIGDIVTGQGPTQFYFATGGTVTITQTQGSLTGSLADVDFGELDIGDETLVPGGCATHVASLSFDELLP